jgi:predicted membrane channel-forming protein YqfA (hemolysin III family)
MTLQRQPVTLAYVLAAASATPLWLFEVKGIRLAPLFMLVHFLLAYISGLLLGSPIRWVLRRFNWFELHHYLCTALPFSVIPFTFFDGWGQFALWHSQNDPFPFYAITFSLLVVLITATVFWLIARPDRFEDIKYPEYYPLGSI